jgi:hypothetical protein
MLYGEKLEIWKILTKKDEYELLEKKNSVAEKEKHLNIWNRKILDLMVH